MSAWRPYAEPAARGRHIASRDLAPLVGTTPASLAVEERLALEPGGWLSVGCLHSWSVARSDKKGGSDIVVNGFMSPDHGPPPNPTPNRRHHNCGLTRPL